MIWCLYIIGEPFNTFVTTYFQSQNVHVIIFVMVLTWWSNMLLYFYISWYSCWILMAASHLTTSFFDRFERARPVEISCGIALLLFLKVSCWLFLISALISFWNSSLFLLKWCRSHGFVWGTILTCVSYQLISSLWICVFAFPTIGSRYTSWIMLHSYKVFFCTSTLMWCSVCNIVSRMKLVGCLVYEI